MELMTINGLKWFLSLGSYDRLSLVGEYMVKNRQIWRLADLFVHSKDEIDDEIVEFEIC